MFCIDDSMSASHYPLRHSRGGGNPGHVGNVTDRICRRYTSPLAHQRGAVTWMPTFVGMTGLGAEVVFETRAVGHCSSLAGQ